MELKAVQGVEYAEREGEKKVREVVRGQHVLGFVNHGKTLFF